MLDVFRVLEEKRANRGRQVNNSNNVLGHTQVQDRLDEKASRNRNYGYQSKYA